jgi:8-oxo-dGTP diphosphatase
MGSGRPVEYIDRYTAHGIIPFEERIVVVAVLYPSYPYFELPGGGVEEGESEQDAIVRETEEETGLIVRPRKRIASAVQGYQSSDGQTHWRNYTTGFTADFVSIGTKTEPYHHPVLLRPEIAIAGLRHEAHRHFVAEWLHSPDRDRSFHRHPDPFGEHRRFQHRRQMMPTGIVPVDSLDEAQRLGSRGRAFRTPANDRS